MFSNRKEQQYKQIGYLTLENLRFCNVFHQKIVIVQAFWVPDLGKSKVFKCFLVEKRDAITIFNFLRIPLNLKENLGKTMIVNEKTLKNLRKNAHF